MKRKIPGWLMILALITALFFTVMAAVRYQTAAAEEEYEVVGEILATDPETFGIDLTPVPQVFTVTVLPEPTPKPTYREVEALPYYRLDKKDVEVLAKLLWSSPLRDSSSKIKLLWVVFNRVDDATGRFGETVQECVNDTEFTFYDRHARVSDRNRDIVEAELTRWMAYKDGYGIGWHPSRRGVFCRFCGNNNRKIEMLEDPYGKEIK